MKTASTNRRSPESSRRRARNSSKSASASVASGPGSGNAKVRLPPERNAAACTRRPGIAKSGTLTAGYHTVPEKKEAAMEPDTIPAEAVAAAPVTAPALVPDVVAEGLVLGNPEALAAQLESFSKARGLFVDWLFNRLVAGIDFLLIHRKVGPRGQKTECPNKLDAKGTTCPTCGGKATLAKPGAEKICGLLQLRPTFKRDADSWQMLGSEAGLLTLICELVTPTGVVVAEGRGARHRDQDFGDINKAIKMCQKSAQTDAVLRCAGLSELFSQDLEDMPAFSESDDTPPFGPPRRQSAPAAAPPAAADDLQEKLRLSVAATSARKAAPAPQPDPRDVPYAPGSAAWSGKPPAPAADEAPPSDALSKPRIGRLMALLHQAVEQQGVPDDSHEDIFNRALEWLGGWVATTQNRARVTWCSYKQYDALCSQIPVAVEAALQGERRPAPRLVRRTYAAPRRPLR